MDRRTFHSGLAAALLAAVSTRAAAQSGAPAKTDTTPAPDSGHDMTGMPANWTGKEQIGMLIYPEFTALDMVGPQYMFASLMGAKVHVVSKTMQSVRSDTGLVFMPSATFDECPKDLDILFVPGGSTGTLNAIKDDSTLNFLANRGSRAKLVTSVCTGSLLLGAAGLLKGYRATSHWAARDLLSVAGAIPVDERVVRDRNRITGAGVTAGLDFGLSIVEQLRDREYAQAVQLLAEYAPAPPLNAGTPATAPAKVTAMMNDMFVGFVQMARSALQQVPRRG